MTYIEVVTLLEQVANAVNPNGAFYEGRRFDLTTEYNAAWPQIHVYPFIQQSDPANPATNRNDLLIGFWDLDNLENTIEQRRDIIGAMSAMADSFVLDLKAMASVQVLALRKEPQYLSTMGEASGVALQFSLITGETCGD